MHVKLSPDRHDPARERVGSQPLNGRTGGERIFPSPNPSGDPAPVIFDRKPLQLQTAMIEVGAGHRRAGDACRELVTKENCSRSIVE